MSANWGSVGAGNYLSYAAGSFVGTGAYTMAVLVDPAGNDCRLSDWFATATEKGQFLLDTGNLFGGNDFSSGVPTGYSSTSPWVFLAITKAAGAATYRMHYWTYDSTGAGTMTHAVAVGAATHANESPAATTCRVGWSSGTSMNGQIAVAGFWDSALSDANLDTLKSGNLSAWAALSPQLGVQFENWNGSTGDVVFAGSSGVATLNGTVSSGTNPPSFNFTLAGAAYPFELLTQTPRCY